MKSRKPNESDAAYIARLEASNSELRKQNKVAAKVGRAVTWLACDASLAFQAMAEKAGVRSHSSVSAVVQAFDKIAHPQWTPDDASIGDLKFPVDWDLEPVDPWSGDADMELNAGIAAVLEYLDGLRYRKGANEWEHIATLMEGLERPLQGVLDKVRPELAARKPIEIPEDATRDDLASAINEMSWRALDLAQDMACASDFLRRDLRAAALREVLPEITAALRALANQPEDQSQ